MYCIDINILKFVFHFLIINDLLIIFKYIDLAFS